MQVGAVVGPYRIQSELGSGGMGKVYAAVVQGSAAGLADGERVALKVVHPHLLGTPGFLKRFLREAQIGRTVRHPNVVRTFDCDVTREQFFLTMEYVEGQTLRDLLVELERVPENLCRYIGHEIANGLAAIHDAGVIHRDIKPDNVLITEDYVVKVMDLGVARLVDEAQRLSQTGGFSGSLEYAAPESFENNGADVDGRVDLHALGLVLYELSCGVSPYRADDVPKAIRKVLQEVPRRLGDQNPQLSPFFEEVVHCLLEKDREKRFASARELASVLAEGENSAWWHGRASLLRAVTKRPLRRVRIPRETAVYGREEELTRLTSLFRSAASGDGRVVLIEGEAGIGKSRLVDELIGRLQQAGESLDFLFGSYAPGGAATAAGGFSTAFREQFGEAGCADYLKSTPMLVPAFDALLRGEPTPEGREPLTKDSLQTCFVNAARGLAAERMTVILIDDLHFAPDEGRWLFTALSMAVPGHRLLLIGTTRPGPSRKWVSAVTRLDQTTQVELGRLGPKDLAALLKDSFQSEQLALGLAGRIGMKSDGNPFFAFEIIRGLREGQFITRGDDGTWVSTRVIDEIQIPSTVLDLVRARVGDLSEEERDLLDVACCWGFEFDATLVGDALGVARIPALKRFAQIEKKHRLVRCAGEHFVFDHHQVQEALYGALPPQLAREYHAALAEAMESRADATQRDPGGLDGALCESLCDHYLKGARGKQALRYLGAAQSHLTTGYLHERMAALTERALAVPDLLVGVARARVLLRLCEALALMGRRGPQEECAREAERLAEKAADHELRFRAARAVGDVFVDTSRYREAEVALRRGVEIAREAGDVRDEALAAASLGRLFLVQRRLPEARECYERQLEISRELGDRREAGAATGNLGRILLFEGGFEESREHLERDLATSRDLGHRRSEGVALGTLGNTFYSEGRLPEARRHYELHLAAMREVGDRHGEAVSTGNLGAVAASQGRMADARQFHERHLALSREIGDRAGEARAQGNLGRTWESDGHLGEARDHYERKLALACELGSRREQANAIGCLGSVLLLEGRLAEALEHFERELALLREAADRRGEVFALHSMGEAHREAGDLARAAELLNSCFALCEEIGVRDGAAAVHLSLGSLRAASGDPAAARESLVAARDLAAEIDAVGVGALARCHLACLPGGDAEDARAAVEEGSGRLSATESREAHLLLWRATDDPAHLAEARRLLDDAVANVDAETRESMLTNLRLNREIMAACKEHGL